MSPAHFSHRIGRQWREQDIRVFEQELCSCWLWSRAQEKRSSASDAAAVCIILTFMRRSHRNDYMVPKLKPESATPREGYSAFTEANATCKEATMISGRRKRITPFHLEVIQGTGSYHVQVNIWRMYHLVDDKTTLKWLCSYLKHPGVRDSLWNLLILFLSLTFLMRENISGWVGQVIFLWMNGYLVSLWHYSP